MKEASQRSEGKWKPYCLSEKTIARNMNDNNGDEEPIGTKKSIREEIRMTQMTVNGISNSQTKGGWCGEMNTPTQSFLHNIAFFPKTDLDQTIATFSQPL